MGEERWEMGDGRGARGDGETGRQGDGEIWGDGDIWGCGDLEIEL